jgi:hypothetical protein
MKKLTILILAFLITPLMAAGPSLNNITANDFDKISEEFSANFVHRPVSPASPLGAVFGFEVGLIAGLTDAPEIANITKREDPTNSDPFDRIAHAGLYASVSVPMGITGELILLPETELGDVSISHTSMGLKWTFGNLLGIPLIDMAVRGHFSSSELSYGDTIDSVATNISLDNMTYGVNLLVSGNLLLLEPFAGVGIVTRDTELSASGSAQIFDSTFTTSQTQSVDGTSAQVFVGVQANLLIAKLAAQYENVFGTSLTSMKLTFGF